MKYKASDFLSELTNKDHQTIASFIFNEYFSAQVYDKNGKTYEVNNHFYVVNNEDTTKSIIPSAEFDVILNPSDGTPYNLKHKVTGKVYPRMTHVILCSEGDEEEVKIVDLNEYTALPQGKLWEKYLSEILIIPILNKNKEIDFDNKHIVDFFDHSGEEAESDNYDGVYLVWHPQTRTSTMLSFNKNMKPSFDTCYLNTPYSADSIHVALMMPFDWAVSEVYYK